MLPDVFDEAVVGLKPQTNDYVANYLAAAPIIGG